MMMMMMMVTSDDDDGNDGDGGGDKDVAADDRAILTAVALPSLNFELKTEFVFKVCSRGLVHVLKMLNNEAAKDEKRRSHLSLHGNSPRFGNRKFAGSTSCL